MIQLLNIPGHWMSFHCDQEAFYASGEERDRPELVGKPVIVGGSARETGRGVGDQLRRPAVWRPGAMPAVTARRLSPHGSLSAARDRLLRRGFPTDPRPD
ncbi:MAG: hypothetical protein ABSG53_13560 [Thermoguttaceae bacterium]